MITVEDLINNGFNVSIYKDKPKVDRWSEEVVDNYLTPNEVVSSPTTLLIECYLVFACLLKDDYTAARYSAGEQLSDETKPNTRELEGTIYLYKFLGITKLAKLTGKTTQEVLDKSNDFIPAIF